MLVEHPKSIIQAYRQAGLATRITVASHFCFGTDERSRYGFVVRSIGTASYATAVVDLPSFQDNALLANLIACLNALSFALDHKAHRSNRIEFSIEDFALFEALSAAARGERHENLVMNDVIEEIRDLLRRSGTTAWPRFCPEGSWLNDDTLTQHLCSLLARSDADNDLSAFDLGQTWRQSIHAVLKAKLPAAFNVKMDNTSVRRRTRIHMARRLRHHASRHRIKVPIHTGPTAGQVLDFACHEAQAAQALPKLPLTAALNGVRCTLDIRQGRFRLFSKTMRDDDGTSSPDGTFEMKNALVAILVALCRHLSMLDRSLDIEGDLRDLHAALEEHCESDPVLVHADMSSSPNKGLSFGCVALRADHGIAFAECLTDGHHKKDNTEAMATIRAIERCRSIWPDARRYIVYSDHSSWVSHATNSRSDPELGGRSDEAFIQALVDFERDHGVMVDVVRIRGHTNRVDQPSIAHTMADRLANMARLKTCCLVPGPPSKRWVSEALSALENANPFMGKATLKIQGPPGLTTRDLARSWDMDVETINLLIARSFIDVDLWRNFVIWDTAAVVAQDVWETRNAPVSRTVSA